MDEKKCSNCFWCSIDGYCTISGRPKKTKEPCDKYEPKRNLSR